MSNTQVITTDVLPITLDLPPIKIGQDYEFTIEMLDDNDDPRDTTDWTMQIKGRENNANGEEVFNLTVGSGITHTPAAGKFQIKISDTITSTFNVSKIAWDCLVTDANGDKTFPFEGMFDILESVTR